MRLYYSPTSPYARKVRAVAFEKGLADHIQLISVDPLSAETDELCRLNPIGKVPALVLDDGRVVIESPLICEHLDTLTPHPKLVPIDPHQRLETLTRQAIADGVMDAAYNLVMEGRRPDAQRSPQWSERWRNAILRGTGVMEENIVPDRVDLGDIAAGIALLYLDFRLPGLGWRPARRFLAEWADHLSLRPSLARTAPRLSPPT